MGQNEIMGEKPQSGAALSGEEKVIQAELIGILKGLMADGRVCENEARFLLGWFSDHPAAAEVWPGNLLAARIKKILAEPRTFDEITEADLADLAALIAELTEAANRGETLTPTDGRISLDDDEAEIIFVGKSFSFAGRMVVAPVRVCEDMVREMGGEVKNEPFSALDYLVTGFLGTGDWRHSEHASKIMRALDFRAKGQGTLIISEERWLKGISNI